MAQPLDIDGVNAAALAHRREVMRRLWHPDGRLSAEVRALNPAAPPLFGLHLSMNDAGKWFASTPDDGVTRGVGFVALIAHLAAASDAAAVTLLRRLLPAGAAA